MSVVNASVFTHQFLLAMPGMADPNFSGAVVYVAEHSAKGALGLVINRTMDIDLRTLFERIDLALEPELLAGQPVFFGGPVQTDRGFVLHHPLGQWNSTVVVAEEVGPHVFQGHPGGGRAGARDRPRCWLRWGMPAGGPDSSKTRSAAMRG
jgi:putative transcriptional regulator